MTVADLRDDSSLVYRFDADQSDAFWLARRLCEQWLRERHVRTDVIPDLLLVATELCTGATAGVVLRLFIEGDGVDLVVETGGAALDAPVGDLRLAAALSDEVVLKVTPECTIVRARRHCVVLPE